MKGKSERERGETLEVVTEIVYLGMVTGKNGGCRKEVENCDASWRCAMYVLVKEKL